MVQTEITALFPGICEVDGEGFIILHTLLLYLFRGRGPGLVTPLEGIHGRGAASPLPSMFESPSTVSVVIICCIMIKTNTGGRGCAIRFCVSLLRDVSLGVLLLTRRRRGMGGGVSSSLKLMKLMKRSPSCAQNDYDLNL